MKAAREGEIKLKEPDDFPFSIEDYEKKNSNFVTAFEDLKPEGTFFENYEAEGIDFREKNDDKGLKNGLSFTHIANLFKTNREELRKVKFAAGDEYVDEVIELVEKFPEYGSNFFLASYRSLHQDKKCVYAIIKDNCKKRIIVAFRGSQTLRDWKTNLHAWVKEIETPKLLREQNGEGLKEQTLVHSGFKSETYNSIMIRV